MPPKTLRKLHETLKTLEEKLFSQVDTEVSGLQNDSALSPRGEAQLSRARGQLQGDEAGLRVPAAASEPANEPRSTTCGSSTTTWWSRSGTSFMSRFPKSC